MKQPYRISDSNGWGNAGCLLLFLESGNGGNNVRRAEQM